MTKILTHRLVLRSDCDVEVAVPRDLRKAEADRIATWLGTLVVDVEVTDSVDKRRTQKEGK